MEETFVQTLTIAGSDSGGGAGIQADIKAVADFMSQYPATTTVVEGHTDSVGSPGYNVALSERRANAVKQYLIRKGVDAKRIETQGFGLTKPIATNETEAGRALNRRAEVRTKAQ